jgi:hypothetical protein
VPPPALWQAVSPGLFERRWGYGFGAAASITSEDIDHKQPVAVINDALARRLYPGEDPIGRYLISAAPPARPGGPPAPRPLQIVGIVADTATRTLTETAPASQIYMPMSVAGGPGYSAVRACRPQRVVDTFLRTAVEPVSLSASIRRAVDAIDPKLAIAQTRTLQSSSIALPRRWRSRWRSSRSRRASR